MVEVKSICAKVLSLLIALTLLTTHTVCADVEPRYEELAGDMHYMSLLVSEAELAEREDDLREEVSELRDDLADGDQEAASKIEALEGELFDLVHERSVVISQISEIELVCEASHINLKPRVTKPAEVVAEIGGESVATIVNSRVVQTKLSEDDYDDLLFEEGVEADVAKLQQQYMELYQQMRMFEVLYAQTEKESEAVEYMVEFKKLLPQGDTLLRSLRSKWADIYDTKQFSYNLLLEMMGRYDMIKQGEELFRECAAKVVTLSDGGSKVVGEYIYQKRAMLRYEVAIAQALQLDNAVDSLRRVVQLLEANGDVEQMPDVDIEERNFIEYEAVKFSSKSIYTKSNPIPLATEYPRGTIYRMQLGAYNAPQLATIFRGVYPLSYDKTFGFWTYYCGAYETMAEAMKAQAICRAKGFRRPEIVRWKDGVRRNLGREPLPATKGFKLFITATNELPSTVEALVKSLCGGTAALTQIGSDKYVVSPIANSILTEEFVEALLRESDELEIEIVEL